MLNARQEKNRHHAATVIISLVLGLALSLGYNIWPSERTGIVIAATVTIWGVVAIVRSVVIELKVRRTVGKVERHLEHRGRGVLKRLFGVVFIEDHD